MNMQSAIASSKLRSSDTTLGSGFAARIVQADRRNDAYENIFNARVVLDHASGNANRIKNLLTDIQTKATTAADTTTNTSDRATLVSEINAIAERINSRIQEAQYDENPLLDGTYSGEDRLKFVTGLTTNVDTLLPDYVDLQSESDNLDIASSNEDSGTLSAQFNDIDLTSKTEELIFSKFENEIAKAIDLVNTKIGETEDVTSRLDARVARLKDRELIQDDVNAMQLPQTTMQKIVDRLNSNPIASLQVQGNLTTGGFIRLLNSE